MNTAIKSGRKGTLGALALLLLTSGGFIVAKAATAPPAPANYWSKSKPGDRDEYVRTMQYLLKARNFKVNTDGVFGAQTKQVVMRFQKAHHLVADGIVGGQTWKALVVPVKRGSQGDAVRALQNQLITIGYDDQVTVDGKFGQQTEAAVKKFQENSELKKDGIVGISTWGRLLEEGEEAD